MRLFSSLRARLTLLVAAAALPFLALSLYQFSQSSSRAAKAATDTARRLVQANASRIERAADPARVCEVAFDAFTHPILIRMLATRRPISIADTREDPDWQLVPGTEHIRSWLGVPLIAGNSSLGLCSVDRSTPGVFTAEHVRLAEGLAAQAAVAIQNAQRFDEVRAGRERLRALSEQLVNVQEAERRAMARELHDEIGQELTGLMLAIEGLASLTPEERATRLDDARALVNRLMSQVRELSLDLRPAMLDDLGVVPALLWLVGRFTDRYGVHVRFTHTGLDRRLPPVIETAMYRIVQEALTNVARHAGVGEASVWIRRDRDRVHVMIEDEGAGFDVDAALSNAASNGVSGMRERAQLAGGELSIDSAPGAGTRLTAVLPTGNATAPPPEEDRQRAEARHA